MHNNKCIYCYFSCLPHFVDCELIESRGSFSFISNDSAIKNLPAVQETWVRSLGWEDPLEEGMAAAPAFLPGESHGQRSLAGTVHGVTRVGRS